MTENHKPINDFLNWELSDLEAFLASPDTNENESIEFKGSSSFEKRDLSDSEKNRQLGEPISAFANTQGGYLFLGIEDDSKISGIANKDYDYSRIVNLLTNRTNPPYNGITKIKAIRISAEKSVYIIYIPEFTATPVQNKDYKYYRRVVNKNEPLTEPWIRALYFKSRTPDIDINFNYKFSNRIDIHSPKQYPDIFTTTFNIIISIINNSHIRAQDIRIDFLINNLSKYSHQKVIPLENKRFHFPVPGTKFEGPLFGNGDKKEFAISEFIGAYPQPSPMQFIIKYKRKFERDSFYEQISESETIYYTVYADDAPKKEGKIALKEILPTSGIYNSIAGQMQWKEIKPQEDNAEKGAEN